MADAKDYAFKGLDILGGLGGGIIGIWGGAPAAQGIQSGIGAIKDIVTMATDDGQMPTESPQSRARQTNMRRFDAPTYQPIPRGDADATARARTYAGGGVSSEQAAVWVSSLASRIVLAMAYGGAQMGKTDNPDDAWALAMVLIRRYADRFDGTEREAVAIALQPIRGLTDAAAAISVDLWPLLRAAQDARDERGLQEAGAGFATLLESLGNDRFKDGIRGANVSALKDAIEARIPIPEPLIAHFAEILRTPQKALRAASPDELHPHAERAGYAPHIDYDHDSVMAGLIGTHTEKLGIKEG